MKFKLKKHSRLEAKLYRACAGLGINLLEITRYVRINELPEIACWGHSKDPKDHHDEFIYVNPKTLKLPIWMIQLILRHEILHAAGYENVGGAKEHQLVNIVLDAAINFVLTQAYATKMKKLGARLYPAASAQSWLAIVQPHLEAHNITDEQIRLLWESIWSEQEVPSPTSLYYRLLMDIPQVVVVIKAIQSDNPFRDGENEGIALRKKADQKEENKEGGDGKDEDDKKKDEKPQNQNEENQPKQSDPAEKESKFKDLAEKILEGLESNLSAAIFSQMKSDYFSDIKIQASAFQTNRIKSFLEQINVRQQLDDSTNRILEAMGGKPACQVYPYELTRRSLTYVACGVTKYLPIYWNTVPEGYKPRLAIYIDVSGSMDLYKEQEIYIAQQLQSYFPTKLFCFSGSIKEVDLPAFADGQYPQGGSTSFDAVIEHFLDQTDHEAMVIFTDGESGFTNENKLRFVDSRRRLFVIYFSSKEKDEYEVHSSLDEIAEQTMQVCAKKT